MVGKGTVKILLGTTCPVNVEFYFLKSPILQVVQSQIFDICNEKIDGFCRIFFLFAVFKSQEIKEVDHILR
jgi:hypothetical protein